MNLGWTWYTSKREREIEASFKDKGDVEHRVTTNELSRRL